MTLNESHMCNQDISDKILLVAINTKYTHSNSALLSLNAYRIDRGEKPFPIKQFDLNQGDDYILGEILAAKPEIVAFSVYIWSLEKTLKAASALKTIYPETQIIMGGPEVSWHTEDLLKANPYIDIVVRDEGEETFFELSKALEKSQDYTQIQGITARKNGIVFSTPDRPKIQNLDELPFPFDPKYNFSHKNFTFYEASRGCYSKCAYCLSSIQGSVRTRTLEQIKKDLDIFFESDFKQVRFADRTFNSDKQRAIEIINYIVDNNKKNIHFHFEIQADILSDDVIEAFARERKSIFHLEIGIQSTNPKALKAVNRCYDPERLKKAVKALRSKTQCRLHLDILGGLPYDTYSDFKKSFDDVCSLAPEDIQISLVKILKGTPIEERVISGELVPLPYPPYTVMKTQWLTPMEAAMINDISKLTEAIHNKKFFQKSLSLIIDALFAGSISDFFEKLVKFWRKRLIPFHSISPNFVAAKLNEFVQETTTLTEFQERISDMLSHELKLASNTPGKIIPSPFPPISSNTKQPLFRVNSGIKIFYYKYSPLEESLTAKDNPQPVVYRFSKTGIPTTCLEEFSNQATAFAIEFIQQKGEKSKFKQEWAKRFGEDKSVPDFETILKKLQKQNIIVPI